MVRRRDFPRTNENQAGPGGQSFKQPQEQSGNKEGNINREKERENVRESKEGAREGGRDPRRDHYRNGGREHNREAGRENGRDNFRENNRDNRENLRENQSRPPRNNMPPRQSNYQSQYGSSRYGRNRADETIEDIRTDIMRIEKEIELEIKEIRSLKL